MESVNRITLTKFLIDMALLFISFATILVNTDGTWNQFAAIVLIFVSILGIIRSRNNWYLLFIFFCIFYSNYSICIADYLFRINSYFTSFADELVATNGINILLNFCTLLVVFLPSLNKFSGLKKCLLNNNRSNSLIATGIAIILVFIWFFAFTRPDVIGQRGTPSAIYEYSIILVIIGLYYSGKNQTIHCIYVMIAIAFAMQNFIFGGRITGVQLLACIFLCFYIDRVSIFKMLPIGLTFFIIMSMIGHFRARLILHKDVFVSIMDSLFNGKFTLDTAYSAYFTSLTFLKVLNNMGWDERLSLFLKWVLSIFAGGRVADSNLAQYTQQFYFHYFGGVLPFFAYFYLGILGVFLLCLYLRFLFNLVVTCDESSNGLKRCIAIYISCTVLRWYLYSPSQIFRGVFLLCVVYYFAQLTDAFVKKRRFII